MAVASAVVAVELGCELKLAFEIASEEPAGCGTHELCFASQKHRSSKGAIVMGSDFKLAAKVTWSTIGETYRKLFHMDINLFGRQSGCRNLI